MTADHSRILAVRPRLRGPFTRWPRTADAVLAAFVLLGSLFIVDTPGEALVLRSPRDIPAGALVLITITCGALAMRRSRPLLVLAVTVAGGAVTTLLYWDISAAAIVALYAVGRYVEDLRWNSVGLAAVLCLIGASNAIDDKPWSETGFALLFTVVIWYTGRWVRSRAERAEQLERERAAEAERIAAAERARIARELHDVVAHRVSLMTVQAGAARTVAADDPEAAVAAMEAVEKTGRQALDELRHLLEVLRPDDDASARAPQPGVADLPRLIEQFGQAGIDVSLTMETVGGELPARVDLSTYRIVQEALTNVLKHAGSGAKAAVRLGRENGEVVVEIVDDGDAATILPGSGHGIVGMRERAQLVGGTLDAGPRAGGGFGVVARLPIAGAAG